MGGQLSKDLYHTDSSDHSRSAPAAALAEQQQFCQPSIGVLASPLSPSAARAQIRARRKKMWVLIKQNKLQGFSRRALAAQDAKHKCAGSGGSKSVVVHVDAHSGGAVPSVFQQHQQHQQSCTGNSTNTSDLRHSTLAQLLALLESPPNPAGPSKAAAARELAARLSSSSDAPAAAERGATLQALASHPAAIGALAELLRDPADSSVQLAALSVLQEASTDPQLTSMLLQPAAGVASRLVQLMQGSNSSLKSAAAAVVGNMSKLPPGRLALRPVDTNPIGSAVLAGLSSVLQPAAGLSSQAQHSAACTIARLVPDFVDERGAVYITGSNAHTPHPWPAVEAAIQQLVPDLQSAHEPTAWEASNALCHLADYPPYQALIGQEPGALSSLVGLLPTGASTAVAEKATSTLAALCKGSPANQKRLMSEPSFFSRLQAALATPGYRTHQLCGLLAALEENNPDYLVCVGHCEPCVARLVSCLNTAQRRSYAEILFRITQADSSTVSTISVQPGVEQHLMNTQSYHSGRLSNVIRLEISSPSRQHQQQ